MTSYENYYSDPEEVSAPSYRPKPVVSDEYYPLNNHEKLRRELWNAVYVSHTNQGDYDCGRMADKALAAFDKRFDHPKIKKQQRYQRY